MSGLRVAEQSVLNSYIGDDAYGKAWDRVNKPKKRMGCKKKGKKK
jgi:hypothetical protein